MTSTQRVPAGDDLARDESAPERWSGRVSDRGTVAGRPGPGRSRGRPAADRGVGIGEGLALASARPPEAGPDSRNEAGSSWAASRRSTAARRLGIVRRNDR